MADTTSLSTITVKKLAFGVGPSARGIAGVPRGEAIVSSTTVNGLVESRSARMVLP